MVSLLSLLLKSGADINSKNKLGQAVLPTAALCRAEPNKYEHTTTGFIALLLERGADTEARDNASHTPLISLTKYGC